ncbi:riboflavin kinase/FMN adenylyltransferase [Natranaerovirga hydrolytica]|uniref:Riboflavin biosynthesis protein n=1 Tax=Natranaerovirga hydrolytica TaxID=680378 RepID=A0A4R1N5Q1_9FIRM|nr:bifunctional riboflavin kinase/FAD synthetase [Natranaerovirga hydrolytica]TCK97943.1 riboflavin kinase/FMN adenylyltransferase [Natranaerovirga hydrolytica]
MKYIADTKDFNLKETAVALGNFDGVHKGHQLLINEIIASKKVGLKATIFTFTPHPKTILYKDSPLELVLSTEERKNKLEDLGVDVLIEYPFNKETMEIDPRTFIEEILIQQLDIRFLVVGSDYRFGYKRQGDVHLLEEYSKQYNYQLKVIQKKKLKNNIISSSFIRELIKEGKVDEASKLLGKPYNIIGEVVQGKKIGRTLGFRTANISVGKEKLLPLNGVYMTQTKINGIWYNSVTNIGVKPTVNGKEKNVETHIFDIDLDLYGHTIEVSILKLIREEEKFGTLGQLKNQIEKDIALTKAYFISNNN